MTDYNTFLDKLNGLVNRFEEVSTFITDPEVIADRKRFVKLTKEYHDLECIAKARQEYILACQGIDEAKEMLKNEDDPEMKEYAREELTNYQKRLPEIEEEIK